MTVLSPTSLLNVALAVAASLLFVVFPGCSPTPGHLFGNPSVAVPCPAGSLPEKREELPWHPP